MTLDKSSRSPKATAVRNPIPTLSRCRGSVESSRQAARSTRFNTIDLIQAHIVIDYRPLIGTQHSLERQLLHHRSTHHVSGRSGRRDEQEPGNTEHRTYSLIQLYELQVFLTVFTLKITISKVLFLSISIVSWSKLNSLALWVPTNQKEISRRQRVLINFHHLW